MKTRSLALRAGIVVLFCIAVAQPALYVWQAQLIFHPNTELPRTPADMKWKFDDLTWDVGWHTTNAWFIPCEANAKGTVLFSHGNLGSMSDNLENAATYRTLGYDVLLYDYGGYGKSSGGPSERRCYADARAAWQYLTHTRKVPANKIVLVGRSLGSGPTSQLATEVKPAAIIFESAFHSVARYAQQDYPWFPAFFLWHRFDNERKAPRFTVPALFIHSASDKESPIEHARDLFNATPEPKRFVEIRGGHSNGYVVSRKEYESALNEFLEPIVAPQ